MIVPLVSTDGLADMVKIELCDNSKATLCPAAKENNSFKMALLGCTCWSNTQHAHQWPLKLMPKRQVGHGGLKISIVMLKVPNVFINLVSLVQILRWQM